MRTINVLVNKAPYVLEKRDQWKAPSLFLSEGGDCDCFTANKYILLRTLGFPAKDLRITVVRPRNSTTLHVILIARTGSGKFQKYVLDNEGNYVRTALYADEYVPLISVNEIGAWIHRKKGWALVNGFINPEQP